MRASFISENIAFLRDISARAIDSDKHGPALDGRFYVRRCPRSAPDPPDEIFVAPGDLPHRRAIRIARETTSHDSVIGPPVSKALGELGGVGAAPRKEAVSSHLIELLATRAVKRPVDARGQT